MTNGSEALRIDSSGNVGINETSPSTFNDAGTGGVNFVIGASGSGRGVLTFASEQTGGANEPLGIINFVDSDTTNTATRGARIVGHRGSDADTAYLKFETPDSGAPAERMRIDSAGTVRAGNNLTAAKRDANGVGMKLATSHPATPLEIETQTGDTRYNIRFWQGSTEQGRIETGSGSTTYATSSDYRLKENISPVANGIERLQQLNPRRFNFIAHPSRTVDGFLAHEVQDVVPEAISGEKDAVDDDGNPVYQGIDQSKLVPLLTAALQEAIGKIEALETANASLEARLTALEGGAS